MIFLPECFNYIGVNLFDGLNIAEPIDGPIMARYQSLAKQSGMWLSLGGFQVSNKAGFVVFCIPYRKPCWCSNSQHVDIPIRF